MADEIRLSGLICQDGYELDPTAYYLVIHVRILLIIFNLNVWKWCFQQ